MSSLRPGWPAFARLDAALAREVMRFRARYQLSLDEFRGLHVTDEQVDALLAQLGVPQGEAEDLPPLEPGPATDAVLTRFGLDEAAADVLMLALAPDADPVYAVLYSYLNDDVRRRWPTVDLARRLFGAAEVNAALAPDGPLFGPGLLLPQPLEERRPLPLLEFSANPVLSGHLLGLAVTTRRGLSAEPPGEEKNAGPLLALADAIKAGARPLAVLTGARLSGREAAVCGLGRLLGRPVSRLRMAGEARPRELLRDGILAAQLSGGMLLIEPDTGELSSLAPALQDLPVPLFLLVTGGVQWRPALAGCAAVEIAFLAPDRAERQRHWADALQRAGLLAQPTALADVADRFRLSAAQIEAAAGSLRLRSGLPPGKRGACVANDVIASAREQAGAELSGLAQRVTPSHAWADLVLPGACLRQLHHLAGAIRHRECVFSGWGFAGGPGITALFSGGPGTGKSMSAGVLARDTGLELWRIDLSAVVSKYIGETEKHIERIFELAKDGNAILFFDEADALFGKRSEVKDAHDRYANIEVAFLLQKLEAHDGVVILATNLARNVDPAFSRRLHFVIEFPLPDPGLRAQLWRAAIPPKAPVAADVDFEFLARQFAFAGGDIRVAVLDAAFAAAAEDVPIDMVRLLQAVGRQLLKQGKVPQGSDFRQYQALLAQADAHALRAVAAE
jgi:hypothetical protein